MPPPHRFCIRDGSANGGVSLEGGISEDTAAELRRRGHNIIDGRSQKMVLVLVLP